MSVWDILTAPPDANEEVLRPVLQFQAHTDCVNGIRYLESHASAATLLYHVFLEELKKEL